MKSLIPTIDPKKEEERITDFLKTTLLKTGFKKIVLGLSGGIDSSTCLYLASRAITSENIFVAHLYYFQPLDFARGKPRSSIIQRICSTLKIPVQNQYILSIKPIVEAFEKTLKWEVRSEKLDNEVRDGKKQISPPTSKIQLHTSNISHQIQIRLGNIMARVRMTMLFDLAKKHNALVCGTENKTEHLLGYFTRFGDAASDIEPIQHLYKSQVFALAQDLKVPEEIIKAKPTAGLWSGQTDEGEFGFSYQEADVVLYLYFEKKFPLEKIEKLGHKNAGKIINFALKNSFKHKTPYTL